MKFNHEGKTLHEVFDVELEEEVIMKFLEEVSEATQLSKIAETIYSKREDASVLICLSRILREWMLMKTERVLTENTEAEPTVH